MESSSGQEMKHTKATLSDRQDSEGGGEVGVSTNWGTPIAGCFIEKIPLKWMKTGGTPILGNREVKIPVRLSLQCMKNPENSMRG